MTMDERDLVLIVLAVALVWPITRFLWVHVLMRGLRYALIALVMGIAGYAVLLLVDREDGSSRAEAVDAAVERQAERVAPEGVLDRLRDWGKAVGVIAQLQGSGREDGGREANGESIPEAGPQTTSGE